MPPTRLLLGERMPGEIHELDAATVDRIAAGEVVERPASAVKELVENALDADADRISVRVEAGGMEAIRVTDDGVGMTADQVRLAVREHTTSKIGDIDDLETGVATLGFRGEALHAIGAVSRLTIRTRPRGEREPDRSSAASAASGSGGTELVVNGGDLVSVKPAGCPAGTTVEITDLFRDVPARRKYLKTEATEFAHIQSVVAGYALARPDVAVSLTHDDRETFATPGDGDRRSAVLAVYGREVAANMIEVRDDHDPGGPLDAVHGLVSHPETNRAGREYVNAFVNGRYVRTDAVREAAVDAYGTQLAPDRYPFTVLDCTVPLDTVDVNVHPRKMRVRYRNPAEVKRQVRTAIEAALREEGILRSSAPRGRSAPNQATIDPSSTSDDTVDSTPESTAASTDNTIESAVDGTDESTTADADTRPSADTDSTHATSSQCSRSVSTDPQTRSTTTDASSESSRTQATDSTASSTSHPSPRSPTTRGPDTQSTLRGGDAHTTTEFDNFPALRVLGQLHDTYIIAEADDGLLLIDQHAADERINYERLTERFEGDTTTQALADPVQIELTAGEAALFDSYEDVLARLGFRATRLDDRTVTVTTAPAVVAESAGPKIIRDVLADLVSGENAAEQTVEAAADDVLSDMACYPSITGNTSLTDGSVVDLLSTLDDCENPWACPHGRPVVIHIDSDEIDARFERDYPGHR